MLVDTAYILYIPYNIVCDYRKLAYINTQHDLLLPYCMLVDMAYILHIPYNIVCDYRKPAYIPSMFYYCLMVCL